MKWVGCAHQAGIRRRRRAVPCPAAVFGLEDAAGADVRAARAEVQAEPAPSRAGEEWADPMTAGAVRREIVWIAEVRPALPTVVSAEKRVFGALARAAVAAVAG